MNERRTGWRRTVEPGRPDGERMSSEGLTPKQRVHAVLAREAVDRLPVDLWYTPEVGDSLRAACGVASDIEMYRALGLDKLVWVFMEYVTPDHLRAGAQVGADHSEQRTMWGVPLRGVQAGSAVYAEFAAAPLADFPTIPSLDDYPWWPDVERFDYVGAERRAREVTSEFAVIGPWVSLFEIYCQLRGLEQSLADLIERPEYVAAVLDRVEDIQTRMMRRFFERAADALDLVFISDDIAGQTSLLMSPDPWREHLEPRLRRWCHLVHSYGLKVFYHTDGAARLLLRDVLDCGVDVLNPIQHTCPGMDPMELKREFGDRVVFHGGVDNQHVLPFGRPDDVRRETQFLLSTLGGDGRGYIVCSCHNVQAGTPVENILAMIETVHEWKIL